MTRFALKSSAGKPRDPAGDLEADWGDVAAKLDADGFAHFPQLLSPAECDAARLLYARAEGVRSTVVMARHGFGRGEYKYFAYPLPDLVQTLRTSLYPPLAAIT